MKENDKNYSNEIVKLLLFFTNMDKIKFDFFVTSQRFLSPRSAPNSI